MLNSCPAPVKDYSMIGIATQQILQDKPRGTVLMGV